MERCIRFSAPEVPCTGVHHASTAGLEARGTIVFVGCNVLGFACGARNSCKQPDGA